MNANLTLSEIITIALVVLIVFGPQRLPEMARKAGEIIGKLRQAAASVRDEFTAEYEELAKPITDLDAELKAVKADLERAVPDVQPISLDPDEAKPSAVSGNGATDPFEAELAAAKEDVRAELDGVDPFEAELAAAKEDVRAEIMPDDDDAPDAPGSGEVRELEPDEDRA